MKIDFRDARAVFHYQLYSFSILHYFHFQFYIKMRPYYNSCFAMHTRFEAVLCDLEEEDADVVFFKLREKLSHAEHLLSAYDPEAEVYQLNAEAYEKEAPVSRALWDLLVLGKELYDRSLGYFDLGVWRQAHAGKYKNQVEGRPAGSGIGHVLLNEEERKVRFEEPVAIDTGGMGKGFGLNMLTPILHQYNVRNAFLSFGGSSILTRGRHPHGDHWPFRLKAGETVFQLRGDCVSTSETKTERNGEARYHVYNPKTGALVRRHWLAAVQHRDPLEAEVLSTALLCAEEPEYEALIGNFAPKRIVLVDMERGELVFAWGAGEEVG